MDQAREQSRPYVRQMMGQRVVMHALQNAESFDEAAVRGQAAKGAAIMIELMVIHTRSEVAVQKLLASKQREKMEKCTTATITNTIRAGRVLGSENRLTGTTSAYSGRDPATDGRRVSRAQDLASDSSP